MIDALSLYVKSASASVAGVVVAAAAGEAAPVIQPWLYGGAGLAFIGAVWGYGKLHGRMEAHGDRLAAGDERMGRIEAKLDAVLAQVAVAIDRTEGK